MTDGHPMCAAGEHDFCRVIDGRTIPALVVCSRCGQPPKILGATHDGGPWFDECAEIDPKVFDRE
jgi:hypothetical protein